MRVLIVDDESIARKGLAKILGGSFPGVELREAATVDSARLVLQGWGPDIVLLDVKMPGALGFELIPEVKAKDPYVQFIIISGYDDFQYSKEAIQHRVFDYILKPVKREELVRVVADAQKARNERWNSDYRSLFLELDKTGSNAADTLAGLFPWLKSEYLCVFALGFATRDEREQALASPLKAFHASQNRVIMRWGDNYLFGFVPNAGFSPEDVFAVLPMPWYAAVASLQYEYVAATVRRLKIAVKGHLLAGFGRQVHRLTDLATQPQAAEQVGRIVTAFVSASPALAEEIHRLFLPAYGSFEQLYSLLVKVATALQAECSRQEVTVALLHTLQELVESSMTLAALEEGVQQMVAEAAGAVADKAAASTGIPKAVEYINRHYSQPLSITFMAEYLNMSPTYFSALFKKETGENFLAYLTGVRMAKAQELLAGTGLKIHEVAARVGFENARYFTKVYKKNFGHLPRQGGGEGVDGP